MAMAAAAAQSSTAAEERQPEVQARLGVFFFFSFFGAKYYFSIINFWELNFAVSGDSARVGHQARLDQSSDTRLLRVPTGQRLSPNWRG